MQWMFRTSSMVSIFNFHWLSLVVERMQQRSNASEKFVAHSEGEIGAENWT